MDFEVVDEPQGEARDKQPQQDHRHAASGPLEGTITSVAIIVHNAEKRNLSRRLTLAPRVLDWGHLNSEGSLMLFNHQAEGSGARGLPYHFPNGGRGVGDRVPQNLDSACRSLRIFVRAHWTAGAAV